MKKYLITLCKFVQTILGYQLHFRGYLFGCYFLIILTFLMWYSIVTVCKKKIMPAIL